MLDDIKGLIFDCDGTLVDSAPLYARAWGAGFAVSGAVMADDWYHDRKGLSEHVLMESFEEASGLVLDRSATIATMREAFLAKLTVLREIRAIGDIARAAKGIMPLAVASGGPRAIVEPSLEHTGLAELFAAIVTLDDVGSEAATGSVSRSCPAAEARARCMSGLGGQPHRLQGGGGSRHAMG